MNICSQKNSLITLDYILTEHENKYFDRKSAKINPSQLASLISAFANADGGTIVIGVSDNKKILEGINSFGEDKINDFINAPKNFCKPMPLFEYEFLNIINCQKEEDRLLLLHITSSTDQIIRTTNEETYLRIGDRTQAIKGESLRNLEYSKNTRHYEDEINMDAKISDLDAELIYKYKKLLGAENLDTIQVLKSRGFLKNHNGEEYLTNAAVLLFAKHINQFYPNCRIRFIRYNGSFAQVGTEINIIRDYNIEFPILRIIDEAKLFISTQLREFTALDRKTGKFQIISEYPEFAWQEGIVNAVTHREYSMAGNFIKVSMYDDRLEIESPGKLPNVVTVDNIKDTRYSRNPRLSRVLTEFGWVRELNEGVKRIYIDMKKFFLDDPIYSEPEQSVKLVLKNNILMRTLRQQDRIVDNIGEEIWRQLDSTEQEILMYMMGRGSTSRLALEKYTGKSARTVTNRLNHLINLSIIKINGNKYDKQHTYEMIL